MNVGYEEVLEIVEAGGQLVDVLPAAEYDESHVPGAINLQLKELDAERARSLLDVAQPIVVYCHDGL